MIKITIFLILASLALGVPMYNRTFLMDVMGNNLMFRTNDPTNETDFMYDTLMGMF